MADFSIRVNGIEELNAYLKSLIPKVEKSAQEMIKEMAGYGVVTAKAFLGHIDTGATLTSITGVKSGKHAVIVAGGNAIWVEFGAGVVKNAGKTHPEVVDSEIPLYPHGGYGKGKGKWTNGWYYYSDTQPNHNNYTRTKDGGYLVHTMGIEGNMFMYHTYEALIDKLPEIAKESFKEIFK